MTNGGKQLGKAVEVKKAVEELDKFQNALERLKGEVGKTPDMMLNELEKTLREKDLPELGIKDKEKQDEYVNLIMGRTKEHIQKLKEKRIETSPEKKDVNAFINEIENLPKLKKLIKEAKESKDVLGKFGNFFKGIAKKLGVAAGYVAMLIAGWAKDIEKQEGKKTITSSILEKIAGWLGYGKEKKEKIKSLTADIEKLMKDKKWDEAEEKANELLEVEGLEDKHKKLAERKLKKIAKEREKAKAAAKAAEVKYQKEFEKTASTLKTSGIPFKEFDKSDYEAVLEEVGNDPDELKDVVKTSLAKPRGRIFYINKEIAKHPNLKESEFEFVLADVLLTADQAKHIADTLAKEDNKYQIPDLENLTPVKCRKFIEAVRTGIGMETYEKPAKTGTQVTMEMGSAEITKRISS